MSKEALLETLKQFGPLRPQDEDVVKSLFTSLSVPEKTFLLQEGEVSHTMYFVVKGVARILINSSEGEEITCYIAQEGDFIVVYESFVSGEPSRYFIQTLEPCDLLKADRMGFEHFYQKVPAGNLIGRKLMEYAFMDTVNHLTEFYKFTPEERFQNFLLRYPQLANRIPQSCLASFIGVKPQSLSRIKKRIAGSN